VPRRRAMAEQKTPKIAKAGTVFLAHMHEGVNSLIKIRNKRATF
jgi:hypothetical protein